MVKITDLIGKTMVSVENSNNEELIFTTNTGEKYKLYHDQDCCEDVTIEDICGDLNDLVDHPIIEAEEVVGNQDENPVGVPIPDYQESFTWTFYKFGTQKGFVTIRW